MHIRIKNISLSLMLLLFFSQVQVFGASESSGNFKSKKRIGIGPIEFTDCSQEVMEKKNELRKLLSNELSKRPLLEVVSIENMDRAIGTVERGKSEPFIAWVRRAGIQADVEKIVFGTIYEHKKKYVTDNIARFRITINAMDVKSGDIEIVEPAETERSEDINRILINSGDTVARVYHGNAEITEKNDLSITLSYIYPQNDLRRRGAENGFGCNFNIYVIKPIWMMFSLGLYFFTTENESIKSLYMMPIEVYIPFYIPTFWNFKLIPAIGLGGLASMMKYDELYYRSSGNYHYKVGYFLNPMISARFETNYNVSNKYAIVVTPTYAYVLGKEKRKGIIFTLEMGFKFHF